MCCSYLYQIAHLGDDDDEPEFSSSMPLEEGVTFFFDPRALRNLVLVDELDSLAPIMSCQVCVDFLFTGFILDASLFFSPHRRDEGEREVAIVFWSLIYSSPVKFIRYGMTRLHAISIHLHFLLRLGLFI